MVELTAKQIAEFDQAFAASTDLLTALVASYVAVQAEDRADGYPQQVTVMALAHTLAREWDECQLVSALTVAVAVLGEQAAEVVDGS